MLETLDDMEDGFKTAFIGTITGLVLSVVLVIIKGLGPLYASYVSLFQLLNLVGSILLITKLKYWASGYLIGYLFAMWLLSNFGLVESWLVLLYAIVSIPLIIARFTGKLADFLDNL